MQYSLSYCQGDGFNIYGKIDAKSIFKCLENHNGGTQLAKFEDVLTEKEKKTILHYADECGKIEIPMNNRYCYSLADYIDIEEDWAYDLEVYSGYKNINVEALEKFEKLVRDIFTTLCKMYEEWGYNYFYEIDEEGNETDNIVLDAEGKPFFPDAIVIDGVTVLHTAVQQGLLEFSKKRARVRADNNGLVGDEKIIMIEGSSYNLQNSISSSDNFLSKSLRRSLSS